MSHDTEQLLWHDQVSMVHHVSFDHS